MNCTVWDWAERQSSAEARVHSLPDPPELLVEVTRDQERVGVDLDNVVDTPLNYWWAKFYKEDGSLVKLVQGTELPVVVEIENFSDSEEKLECLLTARDILGNQSKQKITNLFEQVEEIEEEEGSIESEWVDGF